MSESFEVTCPCCGAKLTVDARLGTVLLASPRHAEERDLDRAAQLLARDAERRDSLFEKSMAEQKSKSDLLERKFEEALKKKGKGPVTPPVRDIDLE